MANYPDGMSREEYEKAMAEIMAEQGDTAPTQDEIDGMAEQHHVDSIMRAPADFDTTNDKENFERLIYDVGVHYDSIKFGEFERWNSNETQDSVNEVLANRLVNFSKSWDLYGHRDAYDTDEEAFEDMRKSVEDLDQLKNIHENLCEDFENAFDTPSKWVDMIKRSDDLYNKQYGEMPKETTMVNNDYPLDKNGQFTFDFTKEVAEKSAPEPQKSLDGKTAHKITEAEARERIAQGEFSTDVEPFMSDEEKSNALLREQEEAEDRAWERQQEEQMKKGNQDATVKPTNDFKPFKPRRLPNGVTQYNGFQENEKGELVDDGFSFEEYDKEPEDENGGLGE
jgi:hypothetical protein